MAAEGSDVERPASGFGEQFVRACEAVAMPVHVVAEPLHQRREVAGRDRAEDVRRRLGGLEPLRRRDGAEGVC